MKLILFISLLAFLFAIPKMAVAQPAISNVDERSISITKILPDSPSNLVFNQRVFIDFTYSIVTNVKGIRIFIRPITSGKLTPHYSASRSRIHPVGKGKGTAFFTITSGNTKVDQLRVRVYNANQSRLIFEFFVPVHFTFSPLQAKVKFRIALLKKPVKKTVIVPQKNAPKNEKDKEVVKRIVKPDGTIEIYYSDGSIKKIPSSGGGWTIITPDGQANSAFFSTNVQPADPPPLPSFVVSSATDTDDIWLQSLNVWIEYHNSRLLHRIDLLLESKESFENYQQFEQKNSSSVYEKVSLRYTFLERLLSNSL